MKDLLLGIDVGTTAVKAALFTPDGQLVALGQHEYPLYHVKAGWVEQRPQEWWEATCISIRQALSRVRDGAERIAGVAISSQAPALVPLDANGEPLRNGLIWMDRRSEAQVVELNERFGAQTIFEKTGNRADAFYVASKMLWYRQNEPELLARTRQFLQVNGYVTYKLTDTYTLDAVHTWFTQLYDYRHKHWLEDLCAYVGVEPSQLPPIHPGHHIIGEVTRAAAESTDLRPGTPVMAGTVDATAAALEAGCLNPGIATEMTGTSTAIMIPNTEQLTDFSLIAFEHAVPDISIICGATVASGASLKWYRDEFGQAEKEAARRFNLDPFDLLTQQAARIPPGCGGLIFLPYMMGERTPIWHTNARGVFFGLSLATPKAAFIRAIMEGAVYALRHIIDIAQASGAQFSELRAVGGGTRSRLWNQIKADVLGIPLALPTASVGAPFGDAVLVGMGLDMYPDVGQALDNMVKLREHYEPDPANKALYDELYGVFRDLYVHLHDDFDHLAAIMERQ